MTDVLIVTREVWIHDRVAQDEHLNSQVSLIFIRARMCLVLYLPFLSNFSLALSYFLGLFIFISLS